MAKSTQQNTSKKRIMLRLSSWYRDWKPYFRSRMRQLLSNWWEIIAVVSVALLILSAILGALLLLRPDVSAALDVLNAVFTLISLEIALSFFGFSFFLLFVLSLHPEGRKIADRVFHFKDLTDLEALEVRVGSIENGLHPTIKRVERIDRQLEEIKGRLETIEAILKNLSSKENGKDEDD